MAPIYSEASAPGSLIIMGEYAVLYGYPALVAAIDKRITVRVSPRSDRDIYINSQLGSMIISIDQLLLDSFVSSEPFSYVLTTLALTYAAPTAFGLDIAIDSEFSSQQGLGSSAAVVVALLAALYPVDPIDPMALYRQALRVIQRVQGAGSGADIAASIFGGVIEYRQTPPMIRRIESLLQLPLVIVFSGSKTTTTHALTMVKKRDGALYHALGQLSEMAVALDCITLPLLMQQAQTLLTELGVSTPEINHIIHVLTTAGISGVKISGAGLGDCVIGLGEISHTVETAALCILPVTIGDLGVSVRAL